jgi:hypothetical protein
MMVIGQVISLSWRKRPGLISDLMKDTRPAAHESCKGKTSQWNFWWHYWQLPKCIDYIWLYLTISNSFQLCSIWCFFPLTDCVPFLIPASERPSKFQDEFHDVRLNIVSHAGLICEVLSVDGLVRDSFSPKKHRRNLGESHEERPKFQWMIGDDSRNHATMSLLRFYDPDLWW